MTQNNLKKIEEVLDRGVENIFPNRQALADALSSGRRLKLYVGFDPSAPALHIGNAILLNKMRQFQELGHEIIFLVGDFTGMIGDPTDKLSARRQLSREEVLANAANYQQQAAKYLRFDGENPARLAYNSRWQDDLDFAKLLGLSANFTVQQMLARDMFQQRLAEAKPIFLHEFLYPLAQAYDSVALDVDLEIGGNDQMFNMLCGRDLMKALSGKEKFVMTLKILADGQGRKMGKTAGNAVFLDMPANELYGAVMSWPDEVIVDAFELATTVTAAELMVVKQRLKEGENPKNLKAELAAALVALYHDQEAAVAAAEHFRLAVSEKTAPDDIMEIELIDGDSLFDLASKFYNGRRSKTEIRRLFADKAVYYNGQSTDDLALRPAAGDTVRLGKKDWFKIR